MLCTRRPVQLVPLHETTTVGQLRQGYSCACGVEILVEGYVLYVASMDSRDLVSKHRAPFSQASLGEVGFSLDDCLLSRHTHQICLFLESTPATRNISTYRKRSCNDSDETRSILITFSAFPTTAAAPSDLIRLVDLAISR